MARPSKNTPVSIPQSISPIGTRLAELRRSRGYTQAEVSEKMGLSIKQISDYENNKVHMNDEMIIRFAIFLKVSSDIILGLKSVEIPNESVNTRFTKRLKDLESLPESRKRAVISILDEFIKNV